MLQNRRNVSIMSPGSLRNYCISMNLLMLAICLTLRVFLELLENYYWRLLSLIQKVHSRTVHPVHVVSITSKTINCKLGLLNLNVIKISYLDQIWITLIFILYQQWYKRKPFESMLIPREQSHKPHFPCVPAAYSLAHVCINSPLILFVNKL